MISLLSAGIPYTEKGKMIYSYEEGHRRFVLHCINKAQKLDTAMYSRDEALFIHHSLKKISKLLAYEHKEGTPSIMTKIVYVTIILSFVGLITFLVLSDDFLNVITSDLLLIAIVTGIIALSVLIVGLASYRYYCHTLKFLEDQSFKIQKLVDELNAESKFGFLWEMGEMGLWLRVKRQDLEFYNDYPEDADDEPDDDDLDGEAHHGHVEHKDKQHHD